MNVKELREKKGLTQDQLSAKSGIPRARIAKWEQGKGSPKAADEKVLLGIFGEVVHNGAVVHTEAHPAPDSEYMRKYIDMLERENSRLLSQSETNLKMLVELKGIVLENFALLSSLRYAVALILLNQRKGLIRDLSRKEVSDLVVIAGMLDKVVADSMALSPKMDKVRESIR